MATLHEGTTAGGSPVITLKNLKEYLEQIGWEGGGGGTSGSSDKLTLNELTFEEYISGSGITNLDQLRFKDVGLYLTKGGITTVNANIYGTFTPDANMTTAYWDKTNVKLNPVLPTKSPLMDKGILFIVNNSNLETSNSLQLSFYHFDTQLWFTMPQQSADGKFLSKAWSVSKELSLEYSNMAVATTQIDKLYTDKLDKSQNLKDLTNITTAKANLQIQISSNLGTSTAIFASQKMVNDVNNKTIDNADAIRVVDGKIAQTDGRLATLTNNMNTELRKKWDIQETVGTGSVVRLWGARESYLRRGGNYYSHASMTPPFTTAGSCGLSDWKHIAEEFGVPTKDSFGNFEIQSIYGNDSGNVFARIYGYNNPIMVIASKRSGGEWRSASVYTDYNTSIDKNGFLRASGTATALTTSNVVQTTGTSTSNVMSQKAVTDLTESVGTGKMMREGAYGLGTTDNRYGYSENDLNTYLNMESGFVNGMGSGGFNAYYPFSLMRRYSTNVSIIGASPDTINFGTYTSNHKKWEIGFAHTNKNTSTDRNGVLHAGTKTPLDTLNTSDISSSIADNNTIVPSAGAVYRALGNNTQLTFTGTGNVVRMSEVDKKWDIQDTIGDGKVMREGAYGIGGVGTEDGIISKRDFDELPLVNAIYTIAGTWNNGPRGNISYTGVAQTIVRKYRAGNEFIIIFWENGGYWFRVRSSGSWGDWEQYITTNNTSTDKSGFLRASGSADALITSDILNSLGTATNKTVSQKVVNDVSTRVTTSQSRADSAWTLGNNALAKSENLKDLSNVTTARTNLGLGTSATRNITTVEGSSTTLVASQKLVNDVKVGLNTEIGKKITGGNIVQVTGTSITDVPSQKLVTDQIGLINTEIGKKADNTVNIVAGNGLTGGGTISSNRTITLGTPTEVSTASTNSVTSTGHTHALSSAVKASLAKADNARPLNDGLFKTTVRIDTGYYSSLYLQSGTKNDVIIERSPDQNLTFINRSKAGDDAQSIRLPLADKSGTIALTSDVESHAHPSQFYFFWATTAPAGFVECAGQAINTEYTQLRAQFGTNLPNLRGRYLRGANGTNSGGPRTMQGDVIRNITGTISSVMSSSSDDKGSGVFYTTKNSYYDRVDYRTENRIYTNTINMNVSRSVPTGPENRPLSTSVIICVRLQ